VCGVNGSTLSADNLESQYNTSGISDPTFPATQAQLEQIANVGAAVNTPADSFTLTTGLVTGGSSSNTEALDLVYHTMTDGGSGLLNAFYEFNIGGDGVPTGATITGRLTGGNDDLAVYAYNWGSSSWVQIGEFNGKNIGADDVNNYTLFTSHVGSGANLGKVRIRVNSTGLTGATFRVDQAYVSYAIVARSVGYADGAIWVDTNGSNTNTESYVDGTADNPVSTWAAALTLSSQLNITRFHIINGSTITLSGNSDNFTLIGDNWTLALNGQSITGAHFRGASVTGTGSGAGADFHDCELANGATLTVGACDFFNCAVAGSIVMTEADTYYFDKCYSGVAGTATPDIDFGSTVGNTNLNFRHYSGGIEVKNMGDVGTDRMSLEGDGQIIINSNCTTGTIAIRGNFTITDNTSGAINFSDNARYDIDQPWSSTNVPTNFSALDVSTSGAVTVAATTAGAGTATIANQTIIIDHLTDIKGSTSVFSTGTDTLPSIYDQTVGIKAKTDLIAAGSQVTVVAPVAANNDVSVISGDDYKTTNGRQLDFTYGAWPTLSSSGGVTFNYRQAGMSDNAFTSITGSVVTSSSGSNQTARFELGSSQTDDMLIGTNVYEIRVLANLIGGNIATLVNNSHMTVYSS
jgi:hypothetical protein